MSSHALGLPQTYALGHALGQIPDQLVVFTVEVADADHGVGLTPASPRRYLRWLTLSSPN